MPREPAYGGKRRQDAESAAAIERAKNRMFAASVRLPGHGQSLTHATGGRNTGQFCRSQPWGGRRGGAGSQIVSFVPRPGAVSMSIVPPWASTILRAVGRPRPEPPCFVV